MSRIWKPPTFGHITSLIPFRLIPAVTVFVSAASMPSQVFKLCRCVNTVSVYTDNNYVPLQVRGPSISIYGCSRDLHFLKSRSL